MQITMGLTGGIRRFLLRLLGAKVGEISSHTELKELKPTEQETFGPTHQIQEIHSIWDYLPLKENTQAFHLSKVIDFDQWVDMEEIRRRILELFGIQYKNERSLYPHLKTLTDLSLFETTDVGGKRKWRKKDLLLNLKKTKDDQPKKAKATVEAESSGKQGQ